MPTGATARPNDDAGARRPDVTPRIAVSEEQRPFVWQDGRRLWILDGSATNWILAELRFEPTTCTYVEVRRSNYRWPREAAGALLGRAFAGGQSSADDAARGLIAWINRSESAR